jgi:hypothetical protein
MEFLRELSDIEMDFVSGGALAFGQGPGNSNASAVASNTQGVTAGGDAGLAASTLATGNSGAAAAVFGITGVGTVTVLSSTT